MLVAARYSGDDSVEVFRRPLTLRQRLRERMRKEIISRQHASYQSTRPPYFDSFSDDRASGATALRTAPVDVVANLHLISDFVDHRPFFRSIPRHAPVVWTLHDMAPFTGGCNYAVDCERFVARCGACPTLGSSRAGDLSRHIFQRRARAYGGLATAAVRIVSPSKWMAREAMRSSLLGRFALAVIPYGIDTEAFQPRSRQTARAVFGIPDDMRIVMFVSQYLGNPRKGFDLLIAALKDLNVGHRVGLLSIGVGDTRLAGQVPQPHFAIGELKSERLLSFAYSAADVFVMPSRGDNLPNVLLEAISTGTPAVGFDVGGVSEVVRPGITGLLAPRSDVRQLREAIEEMLRNDAKRRELATQCRRIAVAEYALGIQAERYRDLYHEMLDAAARQRERGVAEGDRV